MLLERVSGLSHISSVQRSAHTVKTIRPNRVNAVSGRTLVTENTMFDSYHRPAYLKGLKWESTRCAWETPTHKFPAAEDASSSHFAPYLL